MADENAPMALIKKLARIRREIPVIEKKGENVHFHYSYMRAEDVAGEIGDKLAHANIILAREEGKVQVLPLQEGRGFFVLVECVYLFIDGDSGETMRVWSCGAGTDGQDKGAYKAQTGALKYALTQALCMRVDHMDPEDDSENADSRNQNRPQNDFPPRGDRRAPSAAKAAQNAPQEPRQGFQGTPEDSDDSDPFA